MKKTFSLPYGKANRDFSLSESNCLGSLDLPELPGVGEIEKAVWDALRNPIRHLPLTEWVRGARRVAVTCPDITREAQACIYLPVLFDELNRAGVSDDQIELCFALGTHRELSRDEIVLVAEFAEGTGGADKFRRWFEMPDQQSVERAMRRDFDTVGQVAWDMHQFAKTIRIIAVTAMSEPETRMLLMEPAPTIEDALDRTFRHLGPEAKGYVMPQGFFTVPMPAHV